MSTAVDVDVYAHDRSASRTFDHVGSAATRNSGLVKKFGTVLVGAFTGAALYNGARDLTRLIADQTHAAAEDEQGQRQLALQLHNSAGANQAGADKAEGWIDVVGRQIGITDDELRPALARMVAATHDVSDAQDDVSLAMDVSAGRHKSLQTVVEALAKAEQGNTAGLGRLGVATKDASGHALTLDQITKDLAKTYEGQAASAAGTAAGKYKILDTQFHELGESIGYWVLPKATAFGAWMLDDGVPAAQEMVHWLGDELGPVARDMAGWFSDNRDELQDFAVTVGEDVVGGLKTMVDIGGGALKLFMALPGPVKQFGGELAVAAVMVPRLSSALGAMKLQAFITDMASAETRTRALSSAARTAAGAGGLALLIDGANRGDAALSTLETSAGLAAAGFAVGGPWGAAIGGAGGLVYSLGTKFGHARAEAEKAYAEIQMLDPIAQAEAELSDLRDTLDQVTGAFTGATRAAVLQKLAEAGLLDTGAKYGLTQRQMVDGAIGHKNALAALTPVVHGYESKLSDLDRQIAAVQEADESWLQPAYKMDSQFGRMTDSALEQVTALEAQKKATQQSLEELRQLPGTLRDDTKEIRATSAATADYTGKLKGIPVQAKTAILQSGIEPSKQAIAELVARYDLARRDVKTLIAATGVDATVAQVQRVVDRIAQVRDKTVTITVQTNHIGGVTSSAGGHSSDPADERGRHPRTSGKGGGLMDRLLGRGGHGGGGAGDWAQVLGVGQLTTAGSDLLAGLVNGIEKGRKPLNKVLDAIHKDVENKLNARDQLVALHDAMAAGFSGFQSSIFSVQGGDEGPVTIEQLLAHAAQQKAQGAQVDQDVQKLLAAGVSQSMIEELQSQGASGIEALHALAGANADQLQQIIADNAAAQASYAHAGQVSADKYYNAQIAAANQQLAIAQGVEATVKKLDDLVGRLEDVTLTVHGTDLQAALVKVKKDKGKK